MKINFNTLGLASGGGNRVIIELANRLCDRGHDVSITAITLDRFGWYGKQNIKANLRTAFPSRLDIRIAPPSSRDVGTSIGRQLPKMRH